LLYGIGVSMPAVRMVGIRVWDILMGHFCFLR